MPIKPRPYQAGDLKRMLELLDRCRTAQRRRDFPGPVDLAEAMSLEPVRRSLRVWADQRGRLAAFAYVDAYDNLCFEVDRRAAGRPPVEAIVDWGVEWLVNASGRSAERLETSCAADDRLRIDDLERSGFIRLPTRTVSLARSLPSAAEAPRLPDGFRIRIAGGEDEIEELVALHRAAFGTTNMTVEERRAMRRAAGYDPALDLVAVADGDRLAAFCLSRVDEAGEGSIDTIGTRPEFRRRGLAHSLLLHSLSLLGSRGLKRVRLSTTSQNDAMLRLADALGFVRDAAMDWFARSLPAAR